MSTQPSVAYFSMEIGLEEGIPTYAGGLGMLAGDTIRSAADMAIPMVAVTLLARKGYFHQRLDPTGWQTEEPVNWAVDDDLTELDARATVQIEGRDVILRAWQYQVQGTGGATVPVLLLDADLEQNQEQDRRLTDYLYGGDAHYRLCQEVILGIGGVRMLRALGYTDVSRYHMNEGHAALLVLELLAEHTQAKGEPVVTQAHVDAIRPQCVFTTHTPVAAGQDKFPIDLVQQILGPRGAFTDRQEEFCIDGQLNMTYLALYTSHYVNGVAKKHREVSQHMFAGYKIDSITNGVHLATWACEEMQALFDRHIPGWREDNLSLRSALSIPPNEIWEAHREAKERLLDFVNRTTNAGFDRDVLTIGFARRATQYKRLDLVFQDIDRLRHIATTAGPLQFIFGGKAHPHDMAGKELIQSIFRVKDELHDNVRIVYLAEYDMSMAKLMTAGVDLWLNTPQPPMEASGTSGMKAAVNGVPSFSILDGWWIEGCIEGITGWAIGHDHEAQHEHDDRRVEADNLYTKLEQVILPLYRDGRDGYIDVMRHAIALNGSFFNTERMVDQYVTKAYFK